MKLQIGNKVKCIKDVQPKGEIRSFTKEEIYECIEADTNYINALLDDTKEPHEVGETNGQLGKWFSKHFIII